MEVGRVGDLKIWDGSIVRLPLVGSRQYEWHDQEKLLDTGRPSHGSGASLAKSRKIGKHIELHGGYPRAVPNAGSFKQPTRRP